MDTNDAKDFNINDNLLNNNKSSSNISNNNNNIQIINNILKRKNNDQDKYNDKNKKIKLNNCNNMKELFLKVFRSIVIKRVINYHLKLFNQYYMAIIQTRDELINYGDRLYLTNLKYIGSEELKPADIPNLVDTLEFNYEGYGNYNHALVEGIIPQSVKVVHMGMSFNQFLNHKDLPSNLESLSFGECFNQFIGPLDLPLSLKSIVFGRDFNNLLVYDSLPPLLEELTFGDQFNQYIEPGILGPNIKKISFGKMFLQDLNSILPTSIEFLRVSEGCFEKSNSFLLASKLPKLSIIQVYSESGFFQKNYYFNNNYDHLFTCPLAIQEIPNEEIEQINTKDEGEYEYTLNYYERMIDSSINNYEEYDIDPDYLEYQQNGNDGLSNY